jgi:hypothetical protein
LKFVHANPIAATGVDVKKHYRKLMSLALFLLALSGAALAQTSDAKVRAQIPFNFYAGNKLLPAGTYTVSLNRVSNNVAIFQPDTGVGTFLFASLIDGSKDGRYFLIFRSSNEGVYVLQNIEEPNVGLHFATNQRFSLTAESRPGSTDQVVVNASGN